MSIKKLVKEHVPDFMLSIIDIADGAKRYALRSLKKASTYPKSKRIISLAEKFRPLYQDELSPKILDDREEYILSGDDTVFIRRAVSEGFRFCNYYLYKFDGSGRFTVRKSAGGWRLYDDKSPGVEEKYSGAVVLYDEECKHLERAKMFLSVCEGMKDYALVNVKDVSAEKNLSGDEIIILAMKSRANIRRAERWLRSRNLCKYIVGSFLWYNPEDQYFDFFTPRANETVLDVGSYDGSTAIKFLEWGGERIMKVYTFEFDPENIKKCRKNLEGYEDRITLVEKGAWHKDETITVDPEFVGTGSSRTSKKYGITASLTTIDSAVKNEPVTLIKMDIEGAELNALHGAAETITRNKPRLAISLYHKPEDVCEIPAYIHSLVPEYKFSLRHYSSTFAETILYAY